MPMRREAYPPSWEAIALAAKDAADWKCSECGQQCRRPGQSVEEFAASRRWQRPGMGEYILEHPQAFMLTVHHPDGDTDNPDARLWVLCSGCHLRADGPRHVASRRRNRRVRHGQMTMEAESTPSVE